MIIEISGCNTHNKGAELMLLAIKQHFDSVDANVRLAVNHWFGPYEDRAKYGLWSKLSTNRFGRSRILIELMPSSFRRAFGLVHDKDTAAILDASGVCLWGSTWSRTYRKASALRKALERTEEEVGVSFRKPSDHSHPREFVQQLLKRSTVRRSFGHGMRFPMSHW